MINLDAVNILFYIFGLQALLKDAGGALEDFGAALALSPHSAHMFYNRGNLYASLTQFDKADADYTKGMPLIQIISGNHLFSLVFLTTPLLIVDRTFDKL